MKDSITASESARFVLSALPGSREDRQRVGELLRCLLADFFTLYLKTKNFHWHMRGAHFRDYHLLLDEQAEELFKATDAIAERARKIGESTLRSIGDIARINACMTVTPTMPLQSPCCNSFAMTMLH